MILEEDWADKKYTAVGEVEVNNNMHLCVWLTIYSCTVSSESGVELSWVGWGDNGVREGLHAPAGLTKVGVGLWSRCWRNTKALVMRSRSKHAVNMHTSSPACSYLSRPRPVLNVTASGRSRKHAAPTGSRNSLGTTAELNRSLLAAVSRQLNFAST